MAISEVTWRLIEGFFTAESLGPQVLKGLSRSIQVYRVLGPTAVTNAFEARAARVLTPLVSRDVELSVLRKRWEQATEGEGQVVLVQGEAGIGKSRLVRAFRGELDATRTRTIVLSCSPHHQSSPLYPVVENWSRALALTPDEGPAARERKLRAFLEGLSLPAASLVPPLAALLGIVHESAAMGPADPDQLRRRILDALVQVVNAMARDHPLLYVLEDVHWIDPSTLELVGHQVDAIEDRPIMMLLTARPEFRSPWIGRGSFSTLSVGRLSRRETEAVIRQVAGTKLSAELVGALIAKVDGVPLFVEELTHSVIETQGQSEARATSVPATLQDALTARLDRLAPVRELIQVAALMGRVFDVEVVRAVTGVDAEVLERALVALVEAV